MKLGALALATALTGCASTAKVDGGFFTFEIPKQWRIENNKQSIVLASGDRRLGMGFLPFLSVQYSAKPEDCGASSLSFLTQGSQALLLGKDVEAYERGSGVREFRVTSTVDGISTIASQICGPKGQIYVSFLSDASMDHASREYLSILNSLRWR